MPKLTTPLMLGILALLPAAAAQTITLVTHYLPENVAVLEPASRSTKTRPASRSFISRFPTATTCKPS